MRLIALLAPVALGSALLACSPQDEATGGEVPEATDGGITKRVVNLDASGITIPPQDGDAEMVVPFGSVRAATEDTLSAALGSIKDRQVNGECPAGPIRSTNYDGITLNFQKDKFVGWFANGGDYLPDASRAELTGDRADMTAVEDSTLGAEYIIGSEGGSTISLLFADKTESAQPTAMWAGVNCLFR